MTWASASERCLFDRPTKSFTTLNLDYWRFVYECCSKIKQNILKKVQKKYCVFNQNCYFELTSSSNRFSSSLTFSKIYQNKCVNLRSTFHKVFHKRVNRWSWLQTLFQFSFQYGRNKIFIFQMENKNILTKHFGTLIWTISF